MIVRVNIVLYCNYFMIIITILEEMNSISENNFDLWQSSCQLFKIKKKSIRKQKSIGQYDTFIQVSGVNAIAGYSQSNFGGLTH